MAALALGRPAPDLRLRAEGGRELRLSELWDRAPLLLVFLRHFG